MIRPKHSADFSCDLSVPARRLPHVWEHTVGSGHARLALRADWQAQLKKAHDELGFKHVRFHGILDDAIGTLTCQQEQWLYSFFNSDRIFDFLLDIGMKPFVELSFMPKTLASGDVTVFNYQSNVTPPKDYPAWQALIRKLVGHWVERYGVTEVRQWFFEVWNEPNLDAFWTGGQADYFKLYRHTVMAIKAVDDNLKVGGPATAKNAWVADFLSFCTDNNLPVDFVSTHHYPTDAFGQPDDDTETQLARSRRSVLREQAHEVHQQAQGKPVFYTEWNTSSNPRDPLHDEAYSAAFVTKTNMEAVGLVQCYSFWTFSDIFEENYFPSLPFHGGFGLLNLYGIAKPVYRAYQLLHRLGDERLPVEGRHATVDAWVVRGNNEITVLCTNWALPRHPIAREKVRVSLFPAEPPVAAAISRIAANNADAKSAWLAMGGPEYLSAGQVRRLNKASELKLRALPYHYKDGTLDLAFSLPPQSVAALTVQFEPGRALRS